MTLKLGVIRIFKTDFGEFSEYSVISRKAHSSVSRRVNEKSSYAVSNFQTWFQTSRKRPRKETGSQAAEKSSLSSPQELLPGIPDQLTLDKIVPQLPWIALRVLSAVSRSWNVAFRTRQIYDARVHAKATEPLRVYIDVPHRGHSLETEGCKSPKSRQSRRLFISSSIDEKCFGYVIPPLPGVQPGREPGFPYRCGVVSTDGKIYIIGGVAHTHCNCLHLGRRKIRVSYVQQPSHRQVIWSRSPNVIVNSTTMYHVTKNGKGHHYAPRNRYACDGSRTIHCPCGHPGSDEVFMLDIAAQVMKWTQCASMLVPRQFSYGGCRVKDGKIHVYGGLPLEHSDKTESEIYDPKTDSWSSTETPLTRVKWDSARLWV